jgi:hypothetical protein
VLAGGSALGVCTGRFLDVQDEPSARLLVSSCRAMSLTPQTGVGNIDPESGPLAGFA